MAKYSVDEIMEVAHRFRNWGRWGDDDEIGTLNRINEDCIRRAAGLVRQGRVISCGLPYDANGPQDGTYGRINPVHQMIATGTDAKAGAQDWIPGLRYADDVVFMPLQCGTQWDGLSHVFYEGAMYNGYPMERVTSSGAQVNAIDKMKDKVVGRGVLLDVPRTLGREWLEPGEGIGGDLLELTCERQGVSIDAGDIVLVRTGQMAQVRSSSQWGDYAGGDAPGIDLSGAVWLLEREIAALATDTWGMEVRPNEVDDLMQPLHVVMIVNAGLLVGEIFDLEALSDDCAADGVYEFMFSAPPLAFTGAVGSPINPIAIK
jgi:kynurenine formamidase